MSEPAGRRRARIAAPAKVNLFLRVLGRRPDGYHEVVTLLQALDLADEVVVEVVADPADEVVAEAVADPADEMVTDLAREGRGKRASTRRATASAAPIRIELRVEGPEPCPPEENLAWRAAERFGRERGLLADVRIVLRKRIPAGGGLGGGSSDAAAVLRALCHLTGVDPRDDGIRAMAAELGSDVPFFLCGSPLALGTGRGEALEPLPPLPEAHLVLCLPPVAVSTARAYEALARARTGAPAGQGAPESGKAAPCEVHAPQSWQDVAARARNDFEAVVPGAHAEILRSLEALRARGATFALLCGSGAASFGLFPERGAAEAAADALTSQLGWPCVAARTLASAPGPA